MSSSPQPSLDCLLQQLVLPLSRIQLSWMTLTVAIANNQLLQTKDPGAEAAARQDVATFIRNALPMIGEMAAAFEKTLAQLGQSSSN